jgi:hypothetical protein
MTICTTGKKTGRHLFLNNVVIRPHRRTELTVSNRIVVEELCVAI